MKRLLVLALVVAATGVLAGCDTDDPAISVDDAEISRADLDEEIRVWWDNAEYKDAVGSQLGGRLDGGAPSPEFVSQIVSNRVSHLATGELLDQLGGEVTDADVQAMREQFDADPTSKAILADFPESWQDKVVSDFAAQAVLEQLLADSGQTPSFGDFDIEVDDRYGSWSSESGAVDVWASTLRERVAGSGAPAPELVLG